MKILSIIKLACTIVLLALLLPACVSSQAVRVAPARQEPVAPRAEKVVTLHPADEQPATPPAEPTQPAAALDTQTLETVTANLGALLDGAQLDLALKGMESSPNAIYYPAVLYVDQAGNRYYIHPDTLRPVEFTIETPMQSTPGAPKTPGELSAIAAQVAASHSTKFETLKDNLAYTGGNKSGENFFFRWEMTGTDVGGMPAIFQVGLKQDGTLFAYLNTLDYLP